MTGPQPPYRTKQAAPKINFLQYLAPYVVKDNNRKRRKKLRERKKMYKQNRTDKLMNLCDILTKV